MSNLYYNYRGDSAAQRGPAPIASSSQHLNSAKDPPPSLSSLPPSAVQQPIQLRLSAPLSVSQSLPPSFSSQQAWSDQSLQQLSQLAPPQPNQHQSSVLPSAFPSVQTSSRPSPNHHINGTRPPPNLSNATRRPPSAYDDPLFQIMGKGYSDKSSRPPTQVPSASLQQPHPQSSLLDQYSQLRSTAPASNVFDPNEFPSLGAGVLPTTQQPSLPPNPSAALLNNNPSFEPSALGAQLGVPTHPINGLGSYSDMYGMNTYGDGSAKAVDAVTGSSVASEFNMQNEDFPALGGNPSQGTMRHTGSVMPNAANGSAASVVTAGSGRMAPTASTMEKAATMSSESFFDGAKGSVSSQLQTAIGRAPVRVDQSKGGLLLGRGAQLRSEYHIGEVSLSNLGAQHVSRGLLQKGEPLLDANQSPSKALYGARSPPHGSPVRGRVMVVETTRKGGEELGTVGGSKSEQVGAESRMSNVNGDGLGMSGPKSNGFRVQQAGGSSLDVSTTDRTTESEKKALTGMVLPPDQFGMKGLLKYVGAEAGGTDANMLSIGVDLTMLGLDLNSQEPLYKTFANPWEGGQGILSSGEGLGTSQKGEEPEYKLPTCYYMQPPSLKNSHFTKFQVETLFYVFYNMPRDVLQVLAAVELYNRKWMYHKDLKLWFHQNEMTEVGQGYERGAYVYFDIKSWEQRPFHDANKQFIQGLMTEDELRGVPIPGQRL